MPPKQSRKSGTQGQQNSKVEVYKFIENYKVLKVIDNDITKKIKAIYDNNVWDLKGKFESLREYYTDELNLELKGIAWLNKVQYLDIPNGTVLDIAEISLQSVIKGEYCTLYTEGKANEIKTEAKYGKRVLFWTKTFPSLKKYKDTDNLEWIIHENSLILYEVLKYNNDNGRTTSTLHGDLKTMTRIIKLLLGPDHELTYKYGALHIAIKDIYDYTDDENLIRTEREIISYVAYEQLIDILDAMEKKYGDMLSKLPENDRNNGLKHTDDMYQLHQMILLLSLYVYTYPSRHENMELEIITDISQALDGKNYILININGVATIIYNEIVKTHKPHKYTLSSKQLQPLQNKLNNLIKYSLTVYPRKFLFIKKNSWSAQILQRVSNNTISEWLRELLDNKNINIAGLRSSFVSYWFDFWNNRQKAICARNMRSSVGELYRAYYKRYKTPDELILIKIEPGLELQMQTNAGKDRETGLIIDDTSPHKNIQRSTEQKNNKEVAPIIVKINSVIYKLKDTDGMNKLQRYLSKPENKEKHINRVKEYGKQANNIAKRLVRELNHKTIDFEKMRNTTREKYKIKCNEEGVYYSDLI